MSDAARSVCDQGTAAPSLWVPFLHGFGVEAAGMSRLGVALQEELNDTSPVLSVTVDALSGAELLDAVVATPRWLLGPWSGCGCGGLETSELRCSRGPLELCEGPAERWAGAKAVDSKGLRRLQRAALGAAGGAAELLLLRAAGLLLGAPGAAAALPEAQRALQGAREGRADGGAERAREGGGEHGDALHQAPQRAAHLHGAKWVRCPRSLKTQLFVAVFP